MLKEMLLQEIEEARKVSSQKGFDQIEVSFEEQIEGCRQGILRRTTYPTAWSDEKILADIRQQEESWGECVSVLWIE